MVKEFTRFSLADGELLENLFIYYFVGMIISRIGSMFVEKILKIILLFKIYLISLQCGFNTTTQQIY